MPGVGTTTYIFKNRAEAAKFTGKILKAQKQARGEKVSRMSVGWAQLKSGLSRQVSLPDASTVAELHALQSLEADLTTMVEKELCTRKPSVFDVPADFRWKRGDAQNNSRHIVVRHWSVPTEKDSSLHTALSMEDKTAGINDYATWAPSSTRYKDWSVSPNPLKRLLTPFKEALDDYTSKDYPIPPDTYRRDKELWVSDKNQIRLRKGAKARETLISTQKQNEHRAKVLDSEEGKAISTTDQSELSSSSEELLNDDIVKSANFRPMPYQKTSSKDENEWQRRSEKHYLPCIGYNKGRNDGQTKFVMFGLDLRKMQNNWHDIKKPYHQKHFYRLFSTGQNCSGMCLSLLLKGGAGHFNPKVPKFVTTPTSLKKYSAKLLETLDSLNICSESLDQKLELYKINQKPSMTLRAICDQLESFPERYSMPSKWKRDFAGLISATKALEAPDQSIDELLPIAEQMVTHLVNLFHDIHKHRIRYDIATPALSAYKLLKERMQEAYENENPDIPFDIN